MFLSLAQPKGSNISNKSSFKTKRVIYDSIGYDLKSIFLQGCIERELPISSGEIESAHR